MSEHSVTLAKLLSLWAIRTQDGSMVWEGPRNRGSWDEISAVFKDVKVSLIKLADAKKFQVDIKDTAGAQILYSEPPETSIDDALNIWKLATDDDIRWRNAGEVSRKLEELLES